MTARDRVHRLVDALPEAVLADAGRVLVAFLLAARAPEARAAADLGAR